MIFMIVVLNLFFNTAFCKRELQLKPNERLVTMTDDYIEIDLIDYPDDNDYLQN